MNLKRALVVLLCYFIASNVIAGDKPTNGKLYYIKGAEDKFLYFDADAGKIRLGGIDKKTSFTVIEPRDYAPVIFLQLPNKQFITAFSDNTIGTSDDSLKDQSFILIPTNDGKYFLESSHGNYVRAHLGDNLVDLSPNQLDWEKLEFIEIPFGKPINGQSYYITNDNKTWLSYNKEEQRFLLKSADFASQLKTIVTENNEFLFELAAGEYLSASYDNTVTIAKNPWSYERFTVENAPKQRYFIRSVHGNYLRFNYHKDQLDLSPIKDEWEALKFIEAEKFQNDYLGDPLLTKLVLIPKPFLSFSIYGNSEPTNYWSSSVPKATIISDYGPRSPSGRLLVLKIDIRALKNLPKDIKNKLKENSVEEVDIFLVIQAAENHIGNDEDGPLYARLRPHGWADPDAPRQFFGNRVKRDFLQGIFDSDQEIADEVQLGQLKAFEVHTHDRALSPKNARLKIDPKITQSFYSMIIDNNNPRGHKKAVITLHWSLNKDDANIFLDLTQLCFEIDENGNKTAEMSCSLYNSLPYEKLKELAEAAGVDDNTAKEQRILVHELFGDVLKALEESSFKDKPMLEKLKKLVKF